jgi:hypothetical protein
MTPALKRSLAVLALWSLGGCAGHAHYAGMQSRDIKALSADDIAGLRAGQGMSMALPAELNGYPGPLHVLQLQAQLALSPQQRQQTEALMAQMKRDAIAAGEELIQAERQLDQLFATRSVTPQSLAAALDKAAQARARVRAVHLQAHLQQVQILSDQQVQQYNRLRGYGG